mmetsp:Transcript_4349/g.12563  ORF Transcript_4349/g.12563 Transcript_4349/m.12563 type:complete len:132 (+) Transcript_4349:1067-1462(+)
MRVVTREELAAHNTAKDCWIGLHGRAFNVTGWLDDHPGGVEVILSLAGKDATADFDEVGHSSDALRTADALLVADLEGVPKTEFQRQPWEHSTEQTPKHGRERPNDESGRGLAIASVVTAALALSVYLLRR